MQPFLSGCCSEVHGSHPLLCPGKFFLIWRKTFFSSFLPSLLFKSSCFFPQLSMFQVFLLCWQSTLGREIGSTKNNSSFCSQKPKSYENYVLHQQSRKTWNRLNWGGRKRSRLGSKPCLLLYSWPESPESSSSHYLWLPELQWNWNYDAIYLIFSIAKRIF